MGNLRKDGNRMDSLFNDNQNYNTNAIATIFNDAFPGRYANFNSCFNTICACATELEKKGVISAINKQKRNRIYSGSDATRIVAEVLRRRTKQTRTPKEPSIFSFLKNEAEPVKNESVIGGWFGNSERTRVQDGILISTQKCYEQTRISIRFDELSYRGVFGRGNETKKASVYISKKNPNNFFIIPGNIKGVQSWALTKTINCYRFAFTVEGAYLNFFKKFVGGYNLEDLILTGIDAPDGEPVKAWGFKAKS